MSFSPFLLLFLLQVVYLSKLDLKFLAEKTSLVKIFFKMVPILDAPFLMPAVRPFKETRFSYKSQATLSM